jgi:predicted PurR-regulated permease PerM
MSESSDQLFQSEHATAPPSQTRVALQILLIVAAVASLIWALYRLERVVHVLILATFLAYVIAPLVQLAERPIRIAGRARRLSRGPAIGVVYLLLAGGACAGAAISPRLIGRGIHLHPLVVIIAVLAGAELDGVTGIFIAVPAVVACTSVHCGVSWATRLL